MKFIEVTNDYIFKSQGSTALRAIYGELVLL